MKDLSVYEIGQLMINANYPKLKTVFCDLEISGKTVNYCACIDDIVELTKDYYYKIPKSTAQALLEDIKQWKVDGVRLNVLSKWFAIVQKQSEGTLSQRALKNSAIS